MLLVALRASDPPLPPPSPPRCLPHERAVCKSRSGFAALEDVRGFQHHPSAQCRPRGECIMWDPISLCCMGHWCPSFAASKPKTRPPLACVSECLFCEVLMGQISYLASLGRDLFARVHPDFRQVLHLTADCRMRVVFLSPLCAMVCSVCGAGSRDRGAGGARRRHHHLHQHGQGRGTDIVLGGTTRSRSSRLSHSMHLACAHSCSALSVQRLSDSSCHPRRFPLNAWRWSLGPSMQL